MQNSSALDQYYLEQEEPLRSCLLALRDIILTRDEHITQQLKYGMPFFSYRDKLFCYLWLHKKYKQPYVGIVEGKHIDHPQLIREKRSRMKIMLFDPEKDLPVEAIYLILDRALNLYRNGIVRI